MKPNNKVLIEDCLDVRKKGSISVREIEGKNINSDTYVVTKNLNNKKCWFPKNLTSIIRDIISSPREEMLKPEFKFELTNKAAWNNWKVLEKFSFNLEKALSFQKNTQLRYGSEFQNLEGE